MNGPSYRIGTLARLTGVSTHALRIWERRYSALTPTRSSGGVRLYSGADLERARLLKQLTDAHHAIGTIARLPAAELRDLARQRRGGAGGLTEPLRDARELTTALVEAAAELDMERCARILRQAAARFSPRDMVLSVIAPVLDEVGRRWQAGQLCIASEHAISALLRTELGQLLALAPPDGAPAIVCATPAGELHELGALIVSALISVHGRRAVYLGPNLPADQIAEAVRLSGAGTVALSVVALDPERARAEVEAVARQLPRSVTLLLGGKAAGPPQARPKRATVMRSLADFDAWLAAESPRPRSRRAKSR